MGTSQEFARLLALNDPDLEVAVVEAVLSQEGIADRILPQTDPPQSVAARVANMSFADKWRWVREFIRQDIDQTNKDLELIVCVKYKYCQRRAANQLLAFLVDFSAAALVFTNPGLWPLAPVLVYLERQGYFKKLCKCPE